jgi:hypothetical protein
VVAVIEGDVKRVVVIVVVEVVDGREVVIVVAAVEGVFLSMYPAACST